MPSRREFLQVGFVASVFPIPTPGGAPSLLVGRNVGTGNRRSLYRVVADVRFADGAAFGLLAEHLGYDVVRITGDITDFWFNDLSLRWKAEAVAIAGVTAHGPLFCLERFGWDHGLRVVFRGTSRADDPLHVRPSSTGRHTVSTFAVDAPRSRLSPGPSHHARRMGDGDPAWRQWRGLDDSAATVRTSCRKAVGVHERRRHRLCIVTRTRRCGASRRNGWYPPLSRQTRPNKCRKWSGQRTASRSRSIRSRPVRISATAVPRRTCPAASSSISSA